MTGPLGPFWRQKATTTTINVEWGWAYIWLNRCGEVCMIEWVS